MKKNYVKMNDGKYLSLGNIINTIKKIANNKNASQVEIFSSIFNVNNINATTINNYCIGYRPIPIELKKIYSDLNEKHKIDKSIYIDIVLSILSILENKIIAKKDDSLNEINTNIKLNAIIKELEILSKKDSNIKNNLVGKTNYESLINYLNYAILSNTQPVYTQDINIKINKEELDDYLKVKLYYGQSYISSLLLLSKKDNMYANAELGSLEFDGLISGSKDYQKCYEYYMKAALKNHPKACWMIANLMLTNKVKLNYDIMWKFLNKSIKLGSAAGYNTLGLLYKNGINKDNVIDLDKAYNYFLISSEMGYAYAFNNIGKLYEEKNNIDEAIKYYKISADMNESWALNKVGEYYRIKGDYNKAFMYYSKSIEAPIIERNNYAYYNLAKYYFENGNNCVNIKKDSKKANEYYKLSGIKK